MWSRFSWKEKENRDYKVTETGLILPSIIPKEYNFNLNLMGTYQTELFMMRTPVCTSQGYQVGSMYILFAIILEGHRICRWYVVQSSRLCQTIQYDGGSFEKPWKMGNVIGSALIAQHEGQGRFSAGRPRSTTDNSVSEHGGHARSVQTRLAQRTRLIQRRIQSPIRGMSQTNGFARVLRST
jgi:hypothetical protein